MLRRIYSPFPLRRQTSLRKPLIIRAAQATDYRQSKALKKQQNKTSRQLFETKKIAEVVGVDRWVDRGTCPFTCWIGGDNMFAPTFLWLWRNGCVTLFGANGVLSLHLTLWQLIIKIQKKICDQNNCYWGKIFDEMARTVCIEHEMSSAGPPYFTAIDYCHGRSRWVYVGDDATGLRDAKLACAWRQRSSRR